MCSSHTVVLKLFHVVQIQATVSDFFSANIYQNVIDVPAHPSQT